MISGETIGIKKIQQLLDSSFDVQGEKINECWDVEFNGLAIDSRNVKAGDVFLAYKGTNTDGREFIQGAIDNGAVAVIAEKNIEWEKFTVVDGKTPVYVFPEVREKVGLLAANYFGNPSANMKVIGLTGTNGKTTCTHILAEALNLLNKSCGVIGTLGNGLWGQLKAANHTTPDPLSLQKTLNTLKNDGAEFIAMEVSSHALDQGRVNGMVFDMAVLTNITHDHLDYHGTISHYAESKKKLFEFDELKSLVLNIDDDYGMLWAKTTASGSAASISDSALKCASYSRKKQAEEQGLPGFNQIMASNIFSNANGLSFDFISSWGNGHISNQNLYGEFNVSNLLAVCCVLFSQGFNIQEVTRVLSRVHGVQGRMQKIHASERPTVVIDFAHTPDALENVLSELKKQSSGKLVCVFGCGGDRDNKKRFSMGKIANRLADKVIVTNDNPRFEDNKKIFTDILSGIKGSSTVRVIEDRADAIAYAINSSEENDIILVSGKGAENYQDINGEKVPYSDIDVVNKIFKLNTSEGGMLH